MKKSPARQKLSTTIKSAVLIVVLSLMIVLPVGVSASIVTSNPQLQATNQKGWLGRTMDQIKTWTRETLWRELKKSGDIAWRQALKYFLNTLAYDMATYIATGDKGQLPMFETKGWGGYLQDVADNTAGTFIESLGQNMKTLKFNLCDINPRISLRINLGLLRTYRPAKPECTFTEMTKDWNRALTQKNFLTNFQDMFNPWSNDVGYALTVQTGIEEKVSGEINAAAQDRIEGKGWRPVRNAIEGNIETPADLVGEAARQPIDKSTASEQLQTGSIVADSIDIFLNTLIGKLIDKWLTQGLVNDFEETTNKLDSLADYYGQNTTEGQTGARERLKSIVEPNFKVKADYDILAELATCPDPNKAGPTNCVIDEKFRQAIEKKMTVGEALKQGYLNGNGVFGFTSNGLEPKFNEGYPYRTMIILRKYRIVPVGWEVAAQKIKDLQGENDSSNTVKGTKNIRDLINCFSEDDDYGAGESAPGWCNNLVDPDWVLKAPQNFCKREGVGPEINSMQVNGQGDNSVLSVLRNDEYCADEQSCIKEKADGSCQLYGYCTAERRQWDFNAKSCQPRYNTCQTFSRSDDTSVSYLENTLDFRYCNAGNSGCLGYCQDYNYAAQAFTCTEAAGQKIHLNSRAEECDAESEGCRQLIRINSGGGANLLTNSGFESPTPNYLNNFGTLNPLAYAGSYSLRVENYDDVNPATPTTFATFPIPDLSGRNFTLSLYARDCADGDWFYLGGDSSSTPEYFSAGSDWVRYSATHTFDFNDDLLEASIYSGGSCLIDNIKLEAGDQPTAYTEYASPASPSLIYEKITPPYLQAACQGANPPEICDNFAGYCSEDEIGCELYTGVNNGVEIPARIMEQDRCPIECVGYDTFVQGETYFDNKRDAYFIPRTARACAAQAAGCDQFTNLDEVARGGEGVEYYTYLRQCVKPTQAGVTCGDFYSWEGSDESGYQLKVESLQATVAGNPTLTGVGPACDAGIYNRPPSDPLYNPDCREYYSRLGAIYYVNYSYTISCTDNCHPYRRTEMNIDNNLTTQPACAATPNAYWDPIGLRCVVCKNGGVWSNDALACIYQAVPGQGRTCSAAQNGCRVYTGNTGNNIRNILTDDFLNGTVGLWLPNSGGSTVSPSNESLILGPDNKGHSIRVNGAMTRLVGPTVTQGKSYVLSFLAKAETGGFDLEMGLYNPLGGLDEFKPVTLNTNWQLYTTILEAESLNMPVGVDEQLGMQTAVGNIFYITNIVLTEIVDRYYLIKGSWNIPASCDQPSPLYMLGCDQYNDRAGKLYNLRQFSRLCPEAAVGCELMIDTKNTQDHRSRSYSNGNLLLGACAPGDPDCLTVPADNPIFVIFDPEKLCSVTEKGCEMVGKPYQFEGQVVYNQTYLKNDPDSYGQTLCGRNAAFCQTFTYNSGEKYFKDPGDQVCEWRTAANLGEAEAWYKKKVKRCGNNNGTLCLSDKDCLAGTSCLLETIDRPCSSSDLKTFGLGGSGNAVYQPTIENGIYWAGACPGTESGCTEYLDPKSQFNNNIIFNGSFQDLDDNFATRADGWSDPIPADPAFSQTINIEPNTVYRLHRQAGSGALTLDCDLDAAGSLREITQTNLLGPATDVITVNEEAYDNSKIFFYRGDLRATCEIIVSRDGGHVKLLKAIVDYQLSDKIDKQSCNGLFDFGQGCIMFNERRQAGADLAALDWDADTTVDGRGPALGPAASENDTNVIIKVTPDRTCDKWLACRSYIKDQKDNNVCFDIGLCDGVDNNGFCNSFLRSFPANQSVNTLGASNIGNLTGYNKVGLNNGSLKDDFYPLGAMQQVGELAQLSNGNFEWPSSNQYPVGWSWTSSGSWDANAFTVIDNPVAAQKEGIGYAPEGDAFLKLGSSFQADSDVIDVMHDTDYFLYAWINTKNLKSGQVKVDILDAAGVPIVSNVVDQPIANDWRLRVRKFNTGLNYAIKIRLYSDAAGNNNSQGNFYFDDIKLKPVLNSRLDWYTPQSCRLYPQSDSKSCDYYDDSGIRQKGWPGYCLEFDRWPGDPNACLLWYPIDKVKGDGIEEGAGYSDRKPLYYSLAQAVTPLYHAYSTTLKDYYNDANYTYLTASDLGLNNDGCRNITGTDGAKYYVCFTSTTMSAIYAYNNDARSRMDSLNNWSSQTACWNHDSYCSQHRCQAFATFKADGTFNYLTLRRVSSCDNQGDHPCEFNVSFYVNAYYSTKIVQVVTPTGQNKYWSSRVYQGSDYKAICTNAYRQQSASCDYSADYKPFGAVYEPEPVSNPYDWDADSTLMYNQPLYFEPNQGQYRAGQLFAVDEVKKLFAKSYGVWNWQAGQHRCSVGTNPQNNGDCFNEPNDCPYSDCVIAAAQPMYCSDDNSPCQQDCATCAQVNRPGNDPIFTCDGLLTGRTCCMPAMGACQLPASPVRVCVGGTRAGQACSDQFCKNGTCQLMASIAGGGHYVPDTNLNSGWHWNPPQYVCRDDWGNVKTNRSGNYTNLDGEYCSIPPIVSNVRVNGYNANVTIPNSQFIRLTFNTKIDSQQLPMVMYAVDWGDSTKTVVSGVEMRDRPQESGLVEAMYHLYSYWDLKAKDNQGSASINCSVPGECLVTPRVQIKDNWGWCSGNATGVPAGYEQCDMWMPFSGVIRVTER